MAENQPQQSSSEPSADEVLAADAWAADQWFKQMQQAESRQPAQVPALTRADAAYYKLGKAGRAIADTTTKLSVDYLPDIAAVAASAGTYALTKNPKLATAAAGAAGAGVDAARDKARGKDVSILKSMGEGGKQAVAEGTGYVGGKLVEKGVNYFRRGGGSGFGRAARGGIFGRTVPDIMEADHFMKGLAKDLYGQLVSRGLSPADAKRLADGSFLAAEATHGRLLDELTAFASGSATASKMTRIKQAREELYDAAIKSYMDTLGPYLSDDEAADLLSKGLKEALNAEGAKLGAVHERIATEVGGEVVDLRNVKTAGDKHRAWRNELKTTLDPEGEGKIIDELDALAEDASFDAVKKYRTTLDTFIGNAPKGSEGRRIALEMRNRITSAMEDSLSKYDTAKGLQGEDSMLETWRFANESYRQFKQTKDTKWVQSIITMIDKNFEGAKALNKVLGPRSEKRLGFIKGLVGENSESWRTIQRWGLEDMFKKAGAVKGEVVKGKRLEQLLSGDRGGYGGEFTRTLYGPALAGKLKQFGRAVAIQQGKAGVGNRIGIHILETGAIFGLGGAATGAIFGGDGNRSAGSIAGGVSGALAGASGVFISARLLNRWLTNPKNIDAIIHGVQSGWKSREAVATLTRMVAEGGKDEVSMLVSPFASESQIKTLPPGVPKKMIPANQDPRFRQ